MPETVNDKQVFSLLEVTQSVQKTISERYKSSFWIKAELNKLNLYPASGHCYPVLVEKKDGVVIAHVDANIWKDDFISINKNFIKVLKEPLKDGIKILLNAKITYSPVYGLKLVILDIDPSYSLGELAREKLETIEKIRAEGIFNKNKELKLPLLPKRIAIISDKTSKGYSDFISVIEGNPWGYKIFHLLFPSLLQGDKAVDTIISQLRRIKKVKNHFDAVAIIRGGGGDVGLSCYNNFNLSKEIALFPIPIITGIGHSPDDETVVEMVANEVAITPTKLGEFLIQKFHNFSVPVKKAEETLIDKSNKILKDENLKFRNSVKYFRSVTSNMLSTNKNEIINQYKTLSQQSHFIFKREKESYSLFQIGIKKGTISFCKNVKQQLIQIAISMKKDVFSQMNQSRLLIVQNRKQVEKSSKDLLLINQQNIFQLHEKLFEKSSFSIKEAHTAVNNAERDINNMSPKNVLKRGYSITLLNGKAIKNYEQVSQGDAIETIIFDGSLISIIKEVKKSDEL